MRGLSTSISLREAGALAALMAAFVFVPAFIIRSLMFDFNWGFAATAAFSLVSAWLLKLDLRALSTANLLCTGWLGLLAVGDRFTRSALRKGEQVRSVWEWLGLIAIFATLAVAGHYRSRKQRTQAADDAA
jgi:hypothetical protein